jgi:hypothetical protein
VCGICSAIDAGPAVDRGARPRVAAVRRSSSPPALLLAWGLLVAGLAAAQPAAVRAADIVRLDVAREAERYRLHMVAELSAPRDTVFALLSDYDGLTRLSSRVEASRVLPPAADGTTRIYTRLRGCVLFFCRSVDRLESVYEAPPDWIETHVVPESSDFRYGLTRWELTATHQGTRVELESTVEPAFWIPPLIGPPMIERRLTRDGAELLRRLESLALELAREGGRERESEPESGPESEPRFGPEQDGA